ncbi:aminopeptidase P N-terminal domain-containing protein [Sulfurimonas sp.]
MIYEKEYVLRRKKLAKKLSSNAVLIVFSAAQKIRSNDTEFPYRQDSNFYYLTGFKEDKAALVIVKEKKEFKTYLFVTKKDPSLELWTGKRLGQEKAKKCFLVDDVFYYEDLGKKFSHFIDNRYALYYDFKLDYSKVKMIKAKTKNISAYFNAAILIEELRLIKSASEIKLIKKALSITKEAHHKAMQISSSLKYEYELQAEFEYIFKKNGAYSDAYTTIVACGNSANTLHYIANDKKLIKNELILIDAGCEYEYYASDITRTIPVSGKFTQAQKEVYKMVLDVNKTIIEMIRPNILRSELQKKSEELLCRGMLRLGILHGELEELLEEKIYKKYYPHGIGHWMGIDVHDQCPYKTIRGDELRLKAGMVMTIEPGIYLDKDDKSVPKKYRGIGIRIEDDILVTKEGYENLSCDIVKDIDAMQELIRTNSSNQ